VLFLWHPNRLAGLINVIEEGGMQAVLRWMIASKVTNKASVGWAAGTFMNLINLDSADNDECRL
jgi:hypothetical protein